MSKWWILFLIVIALTPEQKAAIKEALINFKYWLDEPNPSEMALWTENRR